MKIERHYECVEEYLASVRDEYIKLYQVYMYGENDIDIWYLPSLEVAKRAVSNLKTVGLGDDAYIKELQCYVDGAGIVWLRVTHIIDD